MRFYNSFIRVLLCLAVFACASAAYAQHHQQGSDREWQAVINNVGRQTHNFRLKDNRDSDNRTYTVDPGQQHATRRRWHGNTSVFVDGKYAGKLRDIGHLESGSNGRVWVLDLHGIRRHH